MLLLRFLLASALSALALPAQADQTVAILPELSVHLKAARYAPVEEDLHWTGWIGAGADVVRVHEVSAYFSADVETIIGNTRRAFEANQANYHLQAGVRRALGGQEVALFFHHVSRHYVDRPKVQAVDWNILGVRLSGSLGAAERPLGYSVSVGRATLASLVGYGLEVTAHADRDLAFGPAAAFYGAADARFVTAEASPELPRGDFLDLSGETGVRFRRERRVLSLFVAYERRNDVFLELPGRRDRALLGFTVRARAR